MLLFFVVKHCCSYYKNSAEVCYNLLHVLENSTTGNINNKIHNVLMKLVLQCGRTKLITSIFLS